MSDEALKELSCIIYLGTVQPTHLNRTVAACALVVYLLNKTREWAHSCAGQCCV